MANSGFQSASVHACGTARRNGYYRHSFGTHSSGSFRGQKASPKRRLQNHLRQIGIALTMYVVSDNHRYPPMWNRESGSVQIWADRLTPYFPLNWTNASWHCPTYVADGGIIQFVSKPNHVFVHTSYSYNAFGIADLGGSPQLGLGVTQLASLASEPEVSAPSEMFAVGDARTAINLPIITEGIVKGLSGEIAMQSYYAYIEETPPLHGKGYNLLFADGHVLLVPRKDYLFPPRAARNWNRDNQPHPEAWAPRDKWVVQK